MVDDTVKRRNARNKRAGSVWETTLVSGLRDYGYDVERLHLNGAEDEGDIRVMGDGDPVHLVIEAKSGEMHAADFVRQAHDEAVNYAAHRGIDRRDVTGVAVVKRKGADWKDGYVLQSVRDYFDLDD